MNLLLDIDVPSSLQIVLPGDIWQLGRHRLLCGDCYDLEATSLLLDGFSPDILHCDPPYGINLKTDWSKTNGRYDAVIGDSAPFDPSPFLWSAPVVLMWGANHYADLLPASSCWIVWDKQCKEGLHRDHADCELCWSSKPGPARMIHHVWDGFRRDSEKGVKRIHPTQKSVAVIKTLLDFYQGQRIYDPFLGSGATVLACEESNRTCRGCEIDPYYCSQIIHRWEQATDRKGEKIHADIHAQGPCR